MVSSKLACAWLLLLASTHATTVDDSMQDEDALPPTIFQEDHEHSHTASVHLATILMITLLLLAISLLAGNLLHRYHIHWLPESGATILIGSIFGAIIHFGLPSAEVEEHFAFNVELFNLFLLPPIIFESGYVLNQTLFFRNFGSISTYAIFGTVISTFFVGGLLHYMGQMDLIFALSAPEALSFAALISAVDPVATLAVFGAQKVDPNLNVLVYGESVLNDAVSIVLFRTFMSFCDHDFVGQDVGKGMGNFLAILFGSAFIGIFVALASARIFKRAGLATLDVPGGEAALFWFFSYLSFIVTESFHFSGIVASLFCGIAMARYTKFNLSKKGQEMVLDVYRVLTIVADTFIFLSVGIGVFTFSPDYKWGLIWMTILLIFVGRALNIFPISAILNFNRHDDNKIPMNHQVMMWFAGLRGAIAVALALTIPEHVVPSKDAILGATMFIVLFTVFVLGGTTVPVLGLLKIQTGCEDIDDDDHIKLTETELKQRQWFKRFDDKWLKPVFRVDWNDMKSRRNLTEGLDPRTFRRDPEHEIAL